MQVRTTGSALVAAAVLSAVLSVVAVGNGRPVNAPEPASAQSSQPQRIATAPGQAPGVVAAPAGTLQASAASRQASALPERPARSLDSYVLQALRGALTYLALFVPLHLALRRIRVGGRWPYAGIGVVAALISIASQTPLSGWQVLFREGRLSLYFAVVLAAGAIMGFLYHYRAGLEADGDHPALLEAALGAPAAAPAAAEAMAGSAKLSPDGSLVDTGAAEYFDGPLQVRTAFPVVFIASLVSAGFFGLAQFAIGFASDMATRLQGAVAMPLHEMLGLTVQGQLHVFLIMGLLAPIPCSFLVLLGHMIARALNKQSYLAYAVTGLCTPFLLILLAGPNGVLYGLMGALPVAISMCVYRSMAGLEPKPVKEDIVVKDRRDLVGASHARRQFGRLIKN